MTDYQGKKFLSYIQNQIKSDKADSSKPRESKLSMNKVIELLGVSKTAVYSYFKSNNLERETVNKILNVFNTTEEEVFGEQETFTVLHELESYRIKKKLSHAELANQIGLSEVALLDVISGHRRIKDEEAKKVYYELGISLTQNNAPEDRAEIQRNTNAKVIAGMSYPVEAGETPFIHLSNGQYLMLMPLVNEYAYAGYLSGFADPVFTDELPKHSIVVDRLHKGVYFGFEVVGDSMDDGSKESIPDGAIATGREIRKEYWQSKFHTHKFKDYIIVSKTDGIIVKRIVDQDIDKGIITCRSLNQDKENYPDFDVHLEDVEQMFNVVNVSAPR